MNQRFLHYVLMDRMFLHFELVARKDITVRVQYLLAFFGLN